MVPHADNKWRNSANNCQLKPPKLWVAPAMYRLYRASAAMGTCTWNWRFKMKQQNANSNRFSMLCMLYSDPNIQIVHPSLWGTGHPSPTLTCTSSASHSQIQAGHEDPPIANDALPVGLVFVSAFKCAEKSEKYTSLACALWTFLPMKSAKYQSSGRLFSILICDTCSEPKKKIWWCFWADVGLCKSLRKQIPQFRAKRCNVAWPSGISAINEVVGMQNHGFFSPNPSVSIVFSGCQKFSHFQNLKKGTPNKSKINVADALANGTNKRWMNSQMLQCCMVSGVQPNHLYALLFEVLRQKSLCLCFGYASYAQNCADSAQCSKVRWYRPSCQAVYSWQGTGLRTKAEQRKREAATWTNDAELGINARSSSSKAQWPFSTSSCARTSIACQKNMENHQDKQKSVKIRKNVKVNLIATANVGMSVSPLSSGSCNML